MSNDKKLKWKEQLGDQFPFERQCYKISMID